MRPGEFRWVARLKIQTTFSGNIGSRGGRKGDTGVSKKPPEKIAKTPTSVKRDAKQKTHKKDLERCS